MKNVSKGKIPYGQSPGSEQMKPTEAKPRKAKLCEREGILRGEIIIYTSDDGTVSLDTKLENDTIWLTQDMIVKLFDSSKAICGQISYFFNVMSQIVISVCYSDTIKIERSTV